VTNAALAAYSIQQELRVDESADLQAVYGVYLIESREVWTPQIGAATGAGLSVAPHDPAGFLELGDAIVRSERIASLIRSKRSSCHAKCRDRPRTCTAGQRINR